ncbi:MAG: hypothetical protein AB8B69_11615 [Chitinophagales bacterium]
MNYLFAVNSKLFTNLNIPSTLKYSILSLVLFLSTTVVFAQASSFGASDSATTLSFGGGDVLSFFKWGLIILGAILLTLGNLYLMQPNWKKEFKQKG